MSLNGFEADIDLDLRSSLPGVATLALLGLGLANVTTASIDPALRAVLAIACVLAAARELAATKTRRRWARWSIRDGWCLARRSGSGPESARLETWRELPGLGLALTWRLDSGKRFSALIFPGLAGHRACRRLRVRLRLDPDSVNGRDPGVC